MPQRSQTAPDLDQTGAVTDHSAPSRGVPVIRVALCIEAALLAAAAVAVVVDVVAQGNVGGREVGMGAFLVAWALGVAGALLAAGRALRARRRSGRAVAMTWQLFQGVVGATAVAAGALWAVALGALLLALAVGVAVLLLTPRVVEATTQH